MGKKLSFRRKNDKNEIQEIATVEQSMSRVELIQMLIPLGLQAVQEVLLEEVIGLAGIKYSRNSGPNGWWGSNPGGVYLGNQRVSIRVPRVRNKKTKKEIPLKSYVELQSSKIIDEGIFKAVLNGLSCRKYKEVASNIPEVFGVKKSAVSSRFIDVSEKKLKEFMERDLSQDDIVAIFVDGKAFAENELIIALGIVMDGSKKILGMIESGTENEKVCKDFIEGLRERGLNTEQEILWIIDGSKGLYKGIKGSLGKMAIIQRCQWHKRENVIKYLPKDEQKRFRKKLQRAYEKPTYEKAKEALLKIEKELETINISAVNSLNEGLEETLTLHKLGLFPQLGTHFKTTNAIENVNRLLGLYTDRVCYWKNSSQRQRWVGSALLEVEKSMRKIKGRNHLVRLREEMFQYNNKNDSAKVHKEAA